MKLGAIDQGTTSSRALLLCDEKAEVCATFKHQQIYPHAGWVEHDPRELLKNVLACTTVLKNADALGLDNQGESCLAWDKKTGEPLAPVIVWQDNRTSNVIEKLKNEGHEERIKELSGLPLDPYFSATKLAWLLEKIPEAKILLREKRLALGTTDAFFLQHLVGRCVTDVTTASRTSLMNLSTLEWDPELCELFGIPQETLPEILPTQTEFGELNVKGRKIPLLASIVDQQAALYGHGCRKAGDAKITLGTGAFALAINGNSPEMNNPHGLLPTVAWQLGNEVPIFALDGGVYNAASAVNWAHSLGLFSTYEEINSFEKPPAVERGLIFVPALSGLGCPHWQSETRAGFEGLSLDTGPLDMAQALLEGVALRIAEVILAMDKSVSIGEEITIDGGLSNNSYICQFLADVLGRRIRVTNEAELTAIGCAQMAGVGLEEVCLFGNGGRLYLPKGKLRQDWIEIFSAAVARLSQST
ncbi:MAG: glycerol kinase [SAR324 cluster bacterium]|nr:glycerol kinase [SAR324 cluster bacterium]MBL7034966.1 glycerol kinase [SAR324 cluster bacterium]